MTDPFELSQQRRQMARRLREDNPRMTKVEIARRVGVSQATVAKYLVGTQVTSPITRAHAATARRNPAINEAVQTVRTTDAFDLRLQGYSPNVIAGMLGVTRQRVKDWIDEEIQSRIEPRVQAYREMLLARLEMYLQKLHPAIERGDVKAIAVAVRISQRYSNLVGADAPIRVDATVHEVTEQDLELQEMIREAQVKGEATAEQLTQQWRQQEPLIDPHTDLDV